MLFCIIIFVPKQYSSLLTFSNLSIQSACLSSLHICNIYHSVFLSYFFHKVLLVFTFTVNNFVFTVSAVVAFVTCPVHRIKIVPHMCGTFMCKLPILASYSSIITDLVLHVFFQSIHEIWVPTLQ